MPLADKQSHLAQFNGGDRLYFNPLSKPINYTAGVKFVAENGGVSGAYWLLDAIFSYKTHPAFRREEFQVWKLVVDQGPPKPGEKVDPKRPMAVLTMDDGNGNVKIRQNIEYTDFDLPEIKFYLENNVLCLPSER